MTRGEKRGGEACAASTRVRRKHYDLRRDVSRDNSSGDSGARCSGADIT